MATLIAISMFVLFAVSFYYISVSSRKVIPLPMTLGRRPADYDHELRRPLRSCKNTHQGRVLLTDDNGAALCSPLVFFS